MAYSNTNAFNGIPSVGVANTGLGAVAQQSSVKVCAYCGACHHAGMMHMCPQKYQDEMRQREYEKTAMLRQQQEMEAQAKKNIVKNLDSTFNKVFLGVNPTTKGDTKMAKRVLSSEEKASITYARARGMDDNAIAWMMLAGQLTPTKVDEYYKFGKLVEAYDPDKEDEEDTKEA